MTALDGPFVKVISGGQTGVDRAALDAAIAAGLPIGGWCPKGRRAEDGPLAAKYPLKETPSDDYAQRTEWNVRDADGTLILAWGSKLQGGTALTQDLARKHHKPCFVVDLNHSVSPIEVRDWAQENHVKVLNVAGPRSSLKPLVYEEAFAWLAKLFSYEFL